MDCWIYMHSNTHCTDIPVVSSRVFFSLSNQGANKQQALCKCQEVLMQENSGSKLNERVGRGNASCILGMSWQLSTASQEMTTASCCRLTCLHHKWHFQRMNVILLDSMHDLRSLDPTIIQHYRKKFGQPGSTEISRWGRMEKYTWWNILFPLQRRKESYLGEIYMKEHSLWSEKTSSKMFFNVPKMQL